MKIGVLALQGDFQEHCEVLRRLGVEAVEVRLPEQLYRLDGMIIPGGESTTIAKLAESYGLIKPLKAFGREKAIWGTCAGAIFLAKEIHRPQPLLQLMNITIQRNAFGRQVESFEAEIEVPELCQVEPEARPYRAIFIRAPLIEAVHGHARALAVLPGGRIVAAREGRLLATSFHPELTQDDRFHRYFISIAS